MITKKEYNVVMIDTENAANVLEILMEYSKTGWEFVAWIDGPPASKVMPYLKYGIFIRDTGVQLDKEI